MEVRLFYVHVVGDSANPAGSLAWTSWSIFIVDSIHLIVTCYQMEMNPFVGPVCFFRCRTRVIFMMGV